MAGAKGDRAAADFCKPFSTNEIQRNTTIHCGGLIAWRLVDFAQRVVVFNTARLLAEAFASPSWFHLLEN
jgi:hypothetical protein